MSSILLRALIGDRQIGDRRLPNCTEMHMGGPSLTLPAGMAFLCLELPKHSHRLVGYISDTKDYYHQVAVSASRSLANCLAFSSTGAELLAAGVPEGALGHRVQSCARVSRTHRVSAASFRETILEWNLPWNRVRRCWSTLVPA